MAMTYDQVKKVLDLIANGQQYIINESDSGFYIQVENPIFKTYQGNDPYLVFFMTEQDPETFIFVTNDDLE